MSLSAWSFSFLLSLLTPIWLYHWCNWFCSWRYRVCLCGGLIFRCSRRWRRCILCDRRRVCRWRFSCQSPSWMAFSIFVYASWEFIDLLMSWYLVFLHCKRRLKRAVVPVINNAQVYRCAPTVYRLAQVFRCAATVYRLAQVLHYATTVYSQAQVFPFASFWSMLNAICCSMRRGYPF